MQTRRNWDIRFDEKVFLEQAGGSLARLLERPAVRIDWEAALADARALVEPAAAWDAFSIREFRHDRLILADGTRIGGGPVADVTAGATELVVGVVTVGGNQRSCILSYGERAGVCRRCSLTTSDRGRWIRCGGDSAGASSGCGSAGTARQRCVVAGRVGWPVNDRRSSSDCLTPVIGVL
jgi:hypothetical protein